MQNPNIGRELWSYGQCTNTWRYTIPNTLSRRLQSHVLVVDPLTAPAAKVALEAGGNGVVLVQGGEDSCDLLRTRREGTDDGATEARGPYVRLSVRPYVSTPSIGLG